MRTPIVIVVLVAAALVAAVKVGVDLRAALGQVDALVGAVAVDAWRAVEPVATPEPAPTPARPVPPPSPAAALDDASAGEAAPRFDVEEAVRAAGDRDPNVAELLNDPDPAVGAAIRDLITQLEAPGGR